MRILSEKEQNRVRELFAEIAEDRDSYEKEVKRLRVEINTLKAENSILKGSLSESQDLCEKLVAKIEGKGTYSNLGKFIPSDNSDFFSELEVMA